MTHAHKAAEHVFGEGAAFFDALLHDIHHAQKCIDLETYIFHQDALGNKIADALCEAATRGVAIRILVDGYGTPNWHSNFQKKLEAVGIQTKVFHPLPWKLSQWKFIKKIPFALRGLYLLLKTNSRNHRKIVLIDHKIAYVSSMNITVWHLPEEQGGKNWRDTGVRLTRVDIAELQNAFDIAWTHRTIQERIRDVFKHLKKEPRIRLNYTRHRRRVLYKNLLKRMRLCQQRIWITNAYFVPDNVLLRRLKEAAKNGVDVRILLPHKSNVAVVARASATFYYDLLKAGIKIYEYLPSMLHAKSLILDDWMLIGSSNLNHRSLLHDLEADITLFTPSAKKTLEQLFLKDLEQSREITLDDWQRIRRWYQRVIGKMALYLKYWM